MGEAGAKAGGSPARVRKAAGMQLPPLSGQTGVQSKQSGQRAQAWRAIQLLPVRPSLGGSDGGKALWWSDQGCGFSPPGTATVVSHTTHAPPSPGCCLHTLGRPLRHNQGPLEPNMGSPSLPPWLCLILIICRGFLSSGDRIWVTSTLTASGRSIGARLAGCLQY